MPKAQRLASILVLCLALLAIATVAVMALPPAPPVERPPALRPAQPYQPPRSSVDVATADFSCDQVESIPNAECEWLVSFFDNTTRAGQWRFSTGWKLLSDPCSWYGVTCSAPDPDSRYVTKLVLTNNGLAGSLPASPGDPAPPSRLQVLDLERNSLSGDLNQQLASLPDSLKILDLSSNLFTGDFPGSLSRLTGLSELRLRSNSLAGTVPPGLCELSEIDLSYNMLFEPDCLKAKEGWLPTQTLSPAGLQVVRQGADALFSWTPIAYREDEGHYEVACERAGATGTPGTVCKTISKTDGDCVWPAPIAAGQYTCSVHAITEKHDVAPAFQKNKLVSSPSSPVSVDVAATAVIKARLPLVRLDPTHTPTPTPTASPTPSATPPPTSEEENDNAAQAKGPLKSGETVWGQPDDPYDFFYFVATASGPITVDLIGHTGSGVQLQLFRNSATAENRVAYDVAEPYRIEYAGDGTATYYIFIYTAGGYNTTWYKLQATFP